MIKLLRVDHRLLHGQVAFAWTGYLGADSILIANDAVIKDDLRKTTLRLAKPQGIKLVMKSIEESIQAINEGQTDKYKLFVVVENIQDAYLIASRVDQIELVNVGSAKAKPNTKALSNNVHILPEEEELLKELYKMGKRIEIRTVPSDNPKYYGG